MARTNKAVGARWRKDAASKRFATFRTDDSYQNFLARVGVGTGNQGDGSTYGFNPTTRLRQLLEWMYRGSWVIGACVDAIPDDMTRAGIEHLGEIKPEDIEKITAANRATEIWTKLNLALKWGRLYGGGIAVMMIDGQDTATPFNIDSVGKNAFLGLLVLDRWMVQPSLSRLVKKFGPYFGLPEYYDTVTDAPALPRMRIHHTRCFRFGGVPLPYYQKIGENLWDMSIVERLYDRLIAFDSTTTGAAQLVYKAHLRTYKIKGFRETVANGGKALEGLVKQLDMVRAYQTNEGLTLMDAEDEFDAHQYTFSGLSDVLLQFGQQLSGATGIPLVRLFGQSPAGLNSTGESDLRTYYDNINREQNTVLTRPLDVICRVQSRSMGIQLPEGWGFQFNPLWQLSDKEKADAGNTVTQAVEGAVSGGLVSRATGLKELKQTSKITGLWSNISDEDIADAEKEPPVSEQNAMAEEMAREAAANGGDDADSGFKDNPRTTDGLPILDVHGIPIIIEHERGSMRNGVRLPCHYGYIRGTGSEEGPHEQTDVMIGKSPHSQHAVLIDHMGPDGDPEETKVMLGYDSMWRVLSDYGQVYPKNAMPNARVMRFDAFNDWLAQRPYGTQPKLIAVR